MNRMNNEFISKIDLTKWSNSTELFYKNNCKITNSAIRNDSLIDANGKELPQKINDELVYTVSEKLKKMVINRKEMLSFFLENKNTKFELKGNKLYVSGFYFYNQKRPHYIIYSDINDAWLLSYDETYGKYILDKKDIKNTGMDHSSREGQKCVSRLYGVIREVEIFSEIYFDENDVLYNTKFIYLGE
ncbi:hypothetical protein [Tenacibaculum aiptasiae]|uniref:hypothetical protein n=1 Tax=Tenacibaculum aiptasiae TaxID=426481 RepID=UPI003B5C0E41